MFWNLHSGQECIRESRKGNKVMNRDTNTNAFRKQSERKRQQRYRKAKKRQRKIRRIKRQIRNFCFLVCLGIAGYAVFNVVERHYIEFPKTANVVVQRAPKKITKPKPYSSSEAEEAIEVLAKSSEKYQRIYDNLDKYPEDLLTALCNNPDMLDFVLGYPGTGEKAACKLTKKEKKQKIPLLIQWDKRWGYKAYGNSCIGISGCAPTCMSMVVTGLTGVKSQTPDKVAAYAADNGYYLEGSGTQWSFMTEGASHFGIHGSEFCLDKNRIMNELECGHPLICSMRPGDFTTQGHFIVLSGTKNGKIVVKDPNNRDRSRVLWDYGTLESQIKNLWVFTK